MRWPSVPIGEHVTIRGGGTPRRDNKDYFIGSIPWITPKDMKVWDIRDGALRITEEAIRSSATTLVPANTVLLVVRSGILKHTVPVAINRVPVAINQDMKSLQCDDKLLPDYLARLLKSAEPTILGWVRATTADNFSIDRLRKLEIPLPPIDEQRRIVGLLNQADELCHKRRQTLETLDAVKLALFHSLLAQKNQTWPRVRISDVALSVRTGPFGSQLLHSEFVASGIAVLGIDNTLDNEFTWAERRYITDDKYRDLQRYRVFHGDVIITIMGTCGRCAIIPRDIPTAINTKHLCCITLDVGRCLPEFLHASVVNDADVRAQLGARERGAVMPGLNMQLIKGTTIALPPINLQRSFAAGVSAVNALKASQRVHLTKLEDLFAALQYRAFSGDVLRFTSTNPSLAAV